MPADVERERAKSSAGSGGPSRPRVRLDQPRPTRRRLLPTYDPEEFGRFSERIARFLGTGRFIVWMTVLIILWVLWNVLAPDSMRWDRYPFIFLTLMLSLQASYAAPLILLAQNRQDDRDRVALEEDRSRATRTIADTEYLSRELAAVRLAVGEMVTRDFLRSELSERGGERGGGVSRETQKELGRVVDRSLARSVDRAVERAVEGAVDRALERALDRVGVEGRGTNHATAPGAGDGGT
jgi:uncharacterized membrane protein